jgi:hypothetical protein
MTYDEIKKLVQENNQSKEYSAEFVICLIWKETNFDSSAKNSVSSATGLMQMTEGAVKQVNRCSPKGVHFQFSRHDGRRQEYPVRYAVSRYCEE